VAGVGRRAGLDVSGKEKMPGLEHRTIQPIVDYILYVSEEGAACISGEKRWRKDAYSRRW